jgi:hypothetical protein
LAESVVEANLVCPGDLTCVHVGGDQEARQILTILRLLEGGAQVGDRRLWPAARFEMDRQGGGKIGAPARDCDPSVSDNLGRTAPSTGDLMLKLVKAGKKLSRSRFQRSADLVGKRRVD